MKIYDILLPIIYLSISIWCFLMAMKGLRTRKLIFPKGTKGTRLENNLFLMWAQVIGTFFLSGGLFVYAIVYTFTLLRKSGLG
jgi:hypothetical protein